MMNSSKQRIVLVTGGAGFIGSNLVDALTEKGYLVRVIDNFSTGKRENLNPRVELFEADIRNLETIRPAFHGVDYVFHLAALARVQPSIEDPITFNDVNVSGTLNVLVASRDAKVKKVIYSASSSAYGNQKEMPLREQMPTNPLSPYGLQKLIGEEYCRVFSKVYGLPTVCLRYFNVYGPKQLLDGGYSLVTGIFFASRLKNEPLPISGDGNNKRDYTFVGDVANANILAAESDVSDGRSFNIGRGHNYSVREVAKMFGGDIVYIKPRTEPKETLADNTLALKILGWAPSMDLPIWIGEEKKRLGLD